jgi:hypothetical protein
MAQVATHIRTTTMKSPHIKTRAGVATRRPLAHILRNNSNSNSNILTRACASRVLKRTLDLNLRVQLSHRGTCTTAATMAMAMTSQSKTSGL